MPINPVFLSSTVPVALTTDMLEPVLDSVVANVGVVLPIAVLLFGMLFGVRMAPKILKQFGK